MVYINFISLIIIFLLISPIYVRFDQDLSIRFFGRYFHIRPKKKGNMLNGIKKVIEKRSLIFNILNRCEVIKFKITESIPFNPYSYALSWQGYYLLRGLVEGNTKRTSNVSYEINITPNYRFDYLFIIKIKLIDIIVATMKYYKSKGEAYGTSNS